MTEFRTNRKTGKAFPLHVFSKGLSSNSMIRKAGRSIKPSKIAKRQDPIDKLDSELDLSKIKVENAQWYTGIENKIQYKITKDAQIEFPEGFGGALKDVGGRKLTIDEINRLADSDESFDFDYESSRSNYHNNVPEKEIKALEYAETKQNNNTYNWSAALDETLNFGTWKDKKGRTFISFSQHRGGDIRGNYTDPEIYEITDLDFGATGEPEGDITMLLNPEITITFKIDDEEFDTKMDGGQTGLYDTTDATGMYRSKLDERIRNTSGFLYEKVEDFLAKK